MTIFAPMIKKLRFTEVYYDDAERLALYISKRDGYPIEVQKCPSDFFPIPPKMKEMPDEINAFSVGNYEIAYLEHRAYEDKDLKYRNRTLHRVQLGDRLRDARESKGMSLEGLGRLTDLKAKNIENIEAGRFDATIDILGNICDALGCHLDFIFD